MNVLSLPLSFDARHRDSFRGPIPSGELGRRFGRGNGRHHRGGAAGAGCRNALICTEIGIEGL